MSTTSKKKKSINSREGSRNKICEEALAIFDEYEKRYNYRPLAKAIELNIRLAKEVEELALLSDNLGLVGEYGYSIERVLKYRHPALRSVEISDEDGNLSSGFINLLNAAIKLQKGDV